MAKAREGLRLLDGRVLLVLWGEAGVTPGEETCSIDRMKSGGRFTGQLVVEVSGSREGVEAMSEHALGVVVGDGTDLHA